jgi:hypothetical protein
MLGRALSLATVTLLIGCFAAAPAWAQATNLEAGKSPSQIFAGTCTACHKSPRGLLKTVPAGSLQGFLRQHYTTSPEMASLLAAFLVSNGAADTRYAQPKEGKDGKGEPKPPVAAEQLDRFGHRLRAAPQEAVKPEVEPHEAAKPDTELPRGRNAKRLARPVEPPAADGQPPAQAATERGPEGRKPTAMRRLGKRIRPGAEEPPKAESPKAESPKAESAKTEEPSKGEPAKDDQPKSEPAKEEGAKPSGEGKSESAKIEAPKESGSGSPPPVLRPDPVPPVTPAPPAAAAPPAASAAVSSGASEPASGPSASPAQPVPAPAPSEPPPVTTASAPPPPPVAPAGPPAPPISK